MKLMKLLLFVVVLLALSSTAHAVDLLKKMPSVTGSVLDVNGSPLDGVKVTAKFYAVKNYISKEGYRLLKELEGVSKSDGSYTLDSCVLNVAGLLGKVSYVEVTFNLEGFNTMKLTVNNGRAAFGGATGVFLTGVVVAILDEEGVYEEGEHSVTQGIADGYKVLKASKMSVAYQKVVEDEPMFMNKIGEKSSDSSKFMELYR